MTPPGHPWVSTKFSAESVHPFGRLYSTYIYIYECLVLLYRFIMNFGSGARIQEDTQRFMAAEEKKFNNTVLLTSGRESVMLGGRGTKRQRKIPQRYQNSTLLLDKEEKEFSHRETKVAQYLSGVFNFCLKIPPPLSAFLQWGKSQFFPDKVEGVGEGWEAIFSWKSI